MSLKGNLQSVDLANVLQMLSINQKEGTLVLFDGDTRKSIYFSKEGVSMLSRGRRGTDTLGRVLLRYGRITPEQLQQALGIQEQGNRRLGEVLEEMGATAPEDIENAVRTQIEEEIYNLFIWKEASFEFIEGPPPPAIQNVPTRVTFNVNSLIMEAQRRADEWNYIRGLVPSLDEIYRPTAQFAEANCEDEVFHFPFTPRVLECLQKGTRNVSELIDDSYAAKFEVCKILAILQEQGAVEPVSLMDLQALATEATNQGDHSQAAKFYLRIVDLGGATPAVNMCLGYALEAMDEPERASVYLKAAAEFYVETLEAKHSFDAYARVARALPTDLEAVTKMVEIAVRNETILGPNNHEVVETGRTLARCLKELGRLPAALQILHQLAQANPQDLSLRNMLSEAYIGSGMNGEAMGELEAMAGICAEQKNFEEAIRYLRKVMAIDRNREGVLKKIDAYTKARDRGKRLAIKVVAAVFVLGAVVAGAWGLHYNRERRKATEAEVNKAVDTALQPLQEQFEASYKAFDAAALILEDWKNMSSVEAIQTEARRLDDALKAMTAATRACEAKCRELFEEHKEKDVLSGSFPTTRPGTIRDRANQAASRKETLFQKIAVGARELFLETKKEAESRPAASIPGIERALGLLRAVEAEMTVDDHGKMVEVPKVLERLLEYRERVAATQKEADRLWDQQKYEESRNVLAKFIGPFYTVREFAETLLFRTRVVTTPAGALVEVLVGPVSVTPASPAPLSLPYTLAEGLRIRVSAEGFESVETGVPPHNEAFTAESLVQSLPVELRVDLDKVPVWSLPLSAGGADAPPAAGPDGASAIVADRAGRIHRIALDDGTLKTYDAESPSGFQGGPVVGAGRAFAASVDGVVVALSLPDLQVLWRHEGAKGPGPVYGRPVLAGDLLVVASDEGTVVAWNAATGVEAWRTRFSAGTRLPLLWVKGWVVAACQDGQIRTLSLDGKEMIEVLPTASDEGTYPPHRAVPVSAGDKILVGLEGKGRPFSFIELPLPGSASPHAGLRWQVATKDVRVTGAVADGDHLVLLFANGVAQRVPLNYNPRTGDLTQALLGEKEEPLSAPALSGNTLFIAHTGGIAAFTRHGAEFRPAWRWAVPKEAPITSPPVVVGRVVLVCTGDGRIHALLRD